MPTSIPVSNVSPVQQKLLSHVLSNLKGLEAELNDIFPGRTHLTKATTLALASAQHILMYGPAGTAKTKFMVTATSAFQDAQIFKIMLTAQTPPSHLIGTQILEKLDKGIVDFNVQNSLVSCDLARLDEWGNTNPMTTVAQNTILHERVFQHGMNEYPSRLMTAFAATNLAPKDFSTDPRIQASIDRFIFKVNIRGLTDRADQVRMIAGSLSPSNYQLRTSIKIEDLRQVQKIFAELNFIGSMHLISAYLDIVEEAEKAFKVDFTDRSTTKIIQLLEVIALMDGQDQVMLDDLVGLTPAFIDGSDPAQAKVFEAIVAKTIKKYEDQLGKQVDGVEKALIEQLSKRVPQITSASTSDEVIRAINTIEEIKVEMQTIKQVALPDTLKKLNDLRGKIEAAEVQIGRYVATKSKAQKGI